MKIRTNVILKEGIDKQAFLDSFDPETQVDCWNMLVALPRMLVLDVEEQFFETLEKDDRLEVVEKVPELPVPTALTYDEFTGDPIAESIPLLFNNGADYMPLGFYLDSDVIPSPGFKIGNTDGDDSYNYQSTATYYTAYTGQHVDVVTVEVGDTSATYNNYDSGHPDFDDIDNPGTSRYIPMDWTDLESVDNNQVTNGRKFSAHGIGVMSAACGTVCGFAKRANIRAIYLSGTDDVVECINALIAWHNTKANNPQTGVPNPTIMIAEYQYLVDTRYALRIDQIASITDLDGTVNRPGGGWGTDFTPFVSRNMIPFRILDPDTSQWHWCIKFPGGTQFNSLHAALEAAWDAGVVCINAAGNNCGIYVKNSDSRRTGVYCTTDSSFTLYDINRTGTTADLTAISVPSTFNLYPFVAYGPHGLDKGIDVGAAQNSEANPLLDGYSNRGPGLDVSGLGADTWTSYPQYSMADGQWGYFSGTSCATPTVVGKAACEMEKYFELNGRWPTPNQVKEIVVNQAKDILISVDPVNWANAPSPSVGITNSQMDFSSQSLNYLQDGIGLNGGVVTSNIAGSPTIRAFWNAKGFNRAQSQGVRPTSGALYPRPKIARNV